MTNFQETECSISEIDKLLANGYEVEIDSPDGWVPVTEFVTKGDFEEYVLSTSVGQVRCNADHYFKTNLGWMKVHELTERDCSDILVSTTEGWSPIAIGRTGEIIPIVDIIVGHPNHRYYTNGVESHNTNVGKAILDTARIPTPSGYKLMGELQVDDLIFGPDGKPTRVLAVYPQGRKPTYQVNFYDGRSVTCCAEHLWEIHRSGKSPKVMNTIELIDTLIKPTYKDRTFVPLCGPVEYESKWLLIPPYTMGFLLGDGHFNVSSVSFTTGDPEPVERMVSEAIEEHHVKLAKDGRTYRFNSTRGTRNTNDYNQAIRDYGLDQARSLTKFIPEDYLRSSVDHRLALLQGLLDADGTVGRVNGNISFCTISPKLRDQIVELVRSLGGIATYGEKVAFIGDQICGFAYNVTIRFPSNSPLRNRLFTIKRKQDRVPAIGKPLGLRIHSVVRTGNEENCTCITVEHPSHLFLANEYVVTHNSLIMCDSAAHNWRSGKNVLYITAEIDEKEVFQRIEGNCLGVVVNDIPAMEKTDYIAKMKRLYQNMPGKLKVKEYPMGSTTVMQFQGLLEELKLKDGFVPDIVYVDYLGVFLSHRASRGTGMYEMGKFVAEDLRAFAQRNRIPVVSAFQLNRGGFSSTDPDLDDSAESFALTHSADLIIMVTATDELIAADCWRLQGIHRVCSNGHIGRIARRSRHVSAWAACAIQASIRDRT